MAIAWISFSVIFIFRAPPATAKSDDSDDDAQAMLQPLNSMLNWGVANSNPEELKRVARMVQDGTAPPNNFDPSVISALFPTPLLDMRALNALACNATVAVAERLNALETLEELVQKRDNARGLPRLDSFACLKLLLTDESAALTSHALWVLGTASRHEPDVQLRMSEHGIVPALSLLLAPSLASASASPTGAAARVAAKLLYALGSLLPGCVPCIHSFDVGGGLGKLQSVVMSPSSYPALLVRKSVTLLTDVMLSLSEAHAAAAPSSSSPHRSESSSTASEHSSATSSDGSSINQSQNTNRGDEAALTCAAAALMQGGSSADVDLRQKSVELIMAIIAKEQALHVVYNAPPCLSDAKSQLASWLQSRLSAGSEDDVQQLEPLSDSLRALEKRLRAGHSSGGKSKKKKKRSLTGGDANGTAPILRLA